MSVHLVTPGPDETAMWRTAISDSGCVHLDGTAEAAGGIGYLLATTLLQTGRIQPTPVPRTRETRRNEAGRVQVALAATRLDVLIHAADRIPARDIDLLALITHRAGVDLWLATLDRMPAAARDQLGRYEPRTWTWDDAAVAWATRPTAGRRTQPWPCQDRLAPGSGLTAAPGCRQHADAIGCVLAWSGHAFAAFNADRRVLQTRFHELSQTPGDRAWSVLAQARDTALFAQRAAEHLGLSAAQRHHLRIKDAPEDCAWLRPRGGRMDVPPAMRPLLAAQRAVRVADGFRPHHELLRVSEARNDYTGARSGDASPANSAA